MKSSPLVFFDKKKATSWIGELEDLKQLCVNSRIWDNRRLRERKGKEKTKGRSELTFRASSIWRKAIRGHLSTPSSPLLSFASSFKKCVDLAARLSDRYVSLTSLVLHRSSLKFCFVSSLTMLRPRSLRSPFLVCSESSCLPSDFLSGFSVGFLEQKVSR